MELNSLILLMSLSIFDTFLSSLKSYRSFLNDVFPLALHKSSSDLSIHQTNGPEGVGMVEFKMASTLWLMCYSPVMFAISLREINPEAVKYLNTKLWFSNSKLYSVNTSEGVGRSRPANSPGFPLSLTVLLQISCSHGLGTETHGFCFLSPAVYKLRLNKCSLGPIIALKCL